MITAIAINSAKLETHYLQQEYSEGPVIDYYVLKINNS